MQKNKFETKIFDSKKELIFRQSLYTQCFPTTKKTILSTNEYYYWKFQSSLNLLKPFEYILLRNKKLVGYYAAIPYEYFYNNNKIISGMVCDVMVSPNFQREGLFSNLGIYSLNKMSKQGVDFTLGNPPKKFITNAHIKVGWQNFFSIPLYVKFVGSKSLLNKIKLSFISNIFNLFINIYNGIFKIIYKSIKFKVNVYQLDEFLALEGIDEFYNEFNKTNEISLIKSKNFLRWRFSRPEKNYKFLVIFQDHKIVSYSVICSSKMSNIDIIAIVDLVSLDEKYIYSLIDFINSDAKKNNIDLINIMLNKEYAKKYNLFNYGFFKSPYKYDFILNNLSKKLNNSFLGKQKNWNISWIIFDDH